MPFLHGYTQYLEQQLDLRIPVTRFQGDIHLSREEKETPPLAGELPERFWIIVAGGKYDFTAKWWNPESYQRVVDHFQDRIQFIQCGEAGHWHPRLAAREHATCVAPRKLLSHRREIEQGEQLRNLTRRFTGEFRERNLRVAERVAQPAECVGDLKGMQIGALPVLDELLDENLLLLGLLYPTRNFSKPCGNGGVESALAADDLEDVRSGQTPDGDGL